MADPVEAVSCPHCGAVSARRISLYGSQLMTSQFQCGGCGGLFEAIRWRGEPGAQRAAGEDEPARDGR